MPGTVQRGMQQKRLLDEERYCRLAWMAAAALGMETVTGSFLIVFVAVSCVVMLLLIRVLYGIEEF